MLYTTARKMCTLSAYQMCIDDSLSVIDFFPFSPKCSTLANIGRSNIYKNKKDYFDVRFFFLLWHAIIEKIMDDI